MGVGHKPGSLKQQNKSHKHGKHSSKGSIDRRNKGKKNVKALTKEARTSLNKKERRNNAQNARRQKRHELLEQRRGKDGTGVNPRLVVVLSLHGSVDVKAALQSLTSCDENSSVLHNEQGITHVSVQRFKQRLAFICPPQDNVHAVLDAVKMSDCVLCLVSTEGMDSAGDSNLSLLCGHGLPSLTFACPGFKSVPPKHQSSCRQNITKQVQRRFPGEKFHCLDSEQDALLLVRHLCQQKVKPVHYRKGRPHLLAEAVAFEKSKDEQGDCGTLKISGYVRGATLSVNGLVHLPGWGDFQMEQIDLLPDPYPLNPNKGRSQKDVEMAERGEGRVLERADPARQQKLTLEVVRDVDMEETEAKEEGEGSEKIASKRRLVKQVVAGASEYQSAWVLDSDEEEDEEDVDSDEDMAPEEEEDSDDEMDEEEEGNPSTAGDSTTVGSEADTEKYDAQMDMEEERRLLEKRKAEKEDTMFPDEIDTPMDIPARVRFAKYCGLESFRTTKWEHREDIPEYYQNIAVGNLKAMKSRILKMPVEGGAVAGSYVTVHVSKVPQAFMEQFQAGSPVVLYGLLPGEQYTSVVNMCLRREQGSKVTIRARDRLIFHVGFRRFAACPIYSSHTAGDKHKFERYFSQDKVVVATVLVPLLFPPAPVLALWEHPDGTQELVARGSVLDCKPDRLVIKRVVLSGAPLKIHKNYAVVRLMFFNREDIQYFKAVRLRSKWGRRGHIIEPMGTHGHMKCYFSGGLRSHQDVVLMSLYKRVFPKPSFEVTVNNPSTVILPSPAQDDSDSEEEESEEESKAAYSMFD